MISADASGYFITGSDTAVGKTYIACQIVTQLCRLGIELETRKPAESGCELSATGELMTHDAEALRLANGERENIDRIVAYRFRAALAPPRAARLENRNIYLPDLIDACERDDSNHRLIVEGAGGFYSPLAEDGLNADLASALQLPVIIVVNDRLGAVNQALMALEAVSSRKLRIAAIVLNQVEANTDEALDNAVDLQPLCDVPLFCCAHGASLAPIFG
ncbi:MAG: dethiobiotin synthase [Gammaproteobacteria bacterium]|nr:dethiobiotin synthase [Gammaproteobacteria bacterium]